MALSLTSEAGPKLPEIISADSPKSSAYAFNGEQDHSERPPKRVVCVPTRREISGVSPMRFPDDVLKGGEFVETDSPSFCLSKVSSSSEPTSPTPQRKKPMGLTDPIFQLFVFALWGVAGRKARVLHY